MKDLEFALSGYIPETELANKEAARNKILAQKIISAPLNLNPAFKVPNINSIVLIQPV